MRFFIRSIGEIRAAWDISQLENKLGGLSLYWINWF